jgi:hypothetical protein
VKKQSSNYRFYAPHPKTVPRAHIKRLKRGFVVILELLILSFQPSFWQELLWAGEIQL